MTASIVASFIYLSFILQLSTGFEVIQPRSRTVNPDGSAIISCEHNSAVGTVIDARLSSVTAENEEDLLCQLKQTDCKDVVIYNQGTAKYLFILLNIGPGAFSFTYRCEFTIQINRKQVTRTGTPTRLLPGQTEAKSTPPPPPAAPAPQSDEQRWTLLEFILIGLLALTLLYSCVFTYYHIRQRAEVNISDPENSTYVEMRKAPPRNQGSVNGHCG